MSIDLEIFNSEIFLLEMYLSNVILKIISDDRLWCLPLDGLYEQYVINIVGIYN